MSAFARLHPRLQEGIAQRLGWSSLRPVQEAAAEALLDGCNAVVLAPTAGGKTEAAVFPALSLALAAGAAGVTVLYLAPLKALLNNLDARLGAYAEMVGLRRFVWHGDVPAADKQAFLKDPAEVLMTTPESLEVMLLSRKVKAAALFAQLRVVIVDEVHALAGSDRGAHLLSVVERAARHSAADLVRVGLSATVGNPDAIARWLQGTSKRPSRVVDPPRARGRKTLLVLHREAESGLAADAAAMGKGQKSLVFCQSRAATEVLAQAMRQAGIEVFVHHGSVSAEARAEAERQFATGRDNAIVCTSTLELGIDVGDLDRVFQVNAPATVSSFLQRMGRTGRRGDATANTTFLCDDPMAVLQCVAVIELARSGWVESVRLHDRCWQVLVQQLMAMALERQGVSADDAYAHLSQMPDFAGVRRAEFDRLVEHLCTKDYLFDAGGRLVFGIAGEKTFGRKNYQEMYAVFSTPVLFGVKTLDGSELGSIEQDYVDRLVPKMSAFLLAGRPWMVETILWRDRVVQVSRAPEGIKPTWSARMPQFLSWDVCRAMRSALLGAEVAPYLHPTAARALAALRAELGPCVEGPEPALVWEGTTAQWWNFAGGRINHSLKHALELRHPWRVTADNLWLRVESTTPSTLRAAMAALAERSAWDEPGFAQALRRKLPDYRLSKFQPAMPEAMAREMVATYLLDIDGAVALLQSMGG